MSGPVVTTGRWAVAATGALIVAVVIILVGVFNDQSEKKLLEPDTAPGLSSLDFTGRWLFLAGSLLATAALVWLLYIGKARSQGRSFGDPPVFEMAVAVVALAAWAFALPDTPLADFEFYGRGYLRSSLA